MPDYLYCTNRILLGDALIFHQDSNHENWQNILHQYDIIEVDIDLSHLLKEMVVQVLDDKIANLIMKEYEKSWDAAKEGLVYQFLREHKGGMIFYKRVEL